MSAQVDHWSVTVQKTGDGYEFVDARGRRMQVQRRHALIAARRKIGVQFPDSPEGAMWRALFFRAVDDMDDASVSAATRRSARRYILENPLALHLCGIDHEWALDVLWRLGLLPFLVAEQVAA